MTYRTYDEYLQTPQFKAVRQAVMNRSGGLCENNIGGCCGGAPCLNPATEVHHVRYCQWGTYDTPSNLIAVCHECHENLHRCDVCGEVVLKAREIKAGRTTCFDCYMIEQD